MIRFNKGHLLESSVLLFSCEEQPTGAGALGASWEGSADCWDSLRLVALCGSKHSTV